MLKTPINVYPSEGEVIYIDKTSENNSGKIGDFTNAPIFRFTFQGDLLSWVCGETYDTNTNELVYNSYCPADGTMYTVHNNTQMRISEQVLAYYGVNGRNYKYRYRLFQNDPQTGAPMCDIYIARGKVDADTTTSTQIYLQKDIKNIRNPYYFNYDDNENSDGHLIGCVYMEIGLERRMITDYNSSTGIATIASGFSTTPKEGTVYKLFCNYIETGYYDFKARYLPKVEITADAVSDGIQCSATYSQANLVGLKSYKFNVYQRNSDSQKVTGTTPENYSSYEGKIDSSHIPIATEIVENIIGKRIDISFTVNSKLTQYCGIIESYDSSSGIVTLKSALSSMPPPNSDYSISMGGETLIETMDKDYSYDLTATFPIDVLDNQFRIECEIVTQEDCRVTESINKTYTSSDDGLESIGIKINDYAKNQTINLPYACIEFTYVSVFRYRVYRKDIDTGEEVYIGSPTTGRIYDYTIANNHTYQYIIVRLNNGNPIHTHKSAEITIGWDGWYISSLEYDKDSLNRHFYNINDTWHFVSSIDSGTITRNINSTLHVGTSSYAKTSRDNTKYESGTFSANLLTLECPNNEIMDNITRVNKWMSFITENQTFMLKSDKGDVWIVNIVNSPSRTYDESLNPILTNVSFEWAEVENVNKMVIL